jgi:hypothetical protein
MEPIPDSDDDPTLFTLYGGPCGLWLRASCCGDDHLEPASSCFVFVLPDADRNQSIAKWQDGNLDYFSYLATLIKHGVESHKAKYFKAIHVKGHKDRVLARGAERLVLHRDEILADLNEIVKAGQA